MATPEDPSCVWPEDQRDANGCYPVRLFINATGGCEIKAGTCFSLETDVEEPMKKHKHKEEIKVEPPVVEEASAAEPIVADTVSMTAVPEAPVTTATVGVDTAIAQMKALVPPGTDPGLMVGGAAGLAMLGAAVKFGPGMLKARAERQHEEKMKQLELEEKKVEKSDSGHESCSVQRAALEARLMALVAKLEQVEARLAAIQQREPAAVVVDTDELEERLEKLEKALKPAKAKKGGKR
jgi:hypothetical protein